MRADHTVTAIGSELSRLDGNTAASSHKTSWIYLGSQRSGSSPTSSTSFSGLAHGDSRQRTALRAEDLHDSGIVVAANVCCAVLWMGCSLGVLLYSIAVLTHVARMGSIGVRCLFGTKVEEEIPADYAWQGSRPQIGDSLMSIGHFEIRDGSYSDYIRTLRGLSAQVGDTIKVRWRDQNTEMVHSALVTVQYPPSWTYYRSCVWFLQELLIFAIGARVFWKRPDDDSAQLFFAVCIVTVGAFMGGYHWTEIVTEPLLIYPFALFAVFVPVVNLHFFLVFPRANPILQKRRRLGLGRDFTAFPRPICWRFGEACTRRAGRRFNTTICRRPPRSSSCASSPWATSAWRCSSLACAFSV